VTAATSALGGTSEVSLIGQQNAAIAAAAQPSAVQVAQGRRLYARDLSITAVLGVGIVTGSGSQLRLNHVTVSNSSKGGIQILGGAFDISNTTVTGNGPAFQDTTAWGGILVQFPPAAGPAKFNLVSVTNNKSVGVVCTGAVIGSGVLATGNAAGDVIPSCGFSACATASPSCGAQP
jgi:hypothetical protein